MSVNEANECAGRKELSDDDCLMTTVDFLSSLGLPEGCFPVERWTDIVQVLSDWSGYTVVLPAHVLDDRFQLVGLKDVLTASPNVFVVTDKCDCCKHIATEDSCRKK